MFLLHFEKDSGSTKYAVEALYYTLQVNISRKKSGSVDEI